MILLRLPMAVKAVRQVAGRAGLMEYVPVQIRAEAEEKNHRRK